MPAAVKYEQVATLKEKLERSKAVFVGEYRGMTVAQSTALRARVREANGELKVAKNTLFAIAMKEAGLAALPEEMMAGPNIYALCYDDPGGEGPQGLRPGQDAKGLSVEGRPSGREGVGPQPALRAG